MEQENGKNKYELNKGDIVYATPASLPVYKGIDFNSEKILTIQKGTEVKVLEKFDNGWCYASTSYRKGYILSEGLSNINPLNIEPNVENDMEFSKEELISRLNVDMDIGKPSGFSLEQFESVLKGRQEDKNGIFDVNCDFFYYAEQEYGINGVFLASLAIHESGWGTSSIAINKNNLFGYQAYDSSPYSSAKQFDTYSEGIDLVARVLIKYYLNDVGTPIYGGNIADGRYYCGNTIKDVNKHYASDNNWANAIYNIMKMLYNNL